MKGYLLSASLLLAVGCTSTTSTQVATPEKVKSLVVVDDTGRERVFIGTKKVGERTVTGIFLIDPSGHQRMVAGTANEGSAGLIQFDETGKRRIFLGTSPQLKGEGLAVMDANGEPKLTVGVSEAGSPTVELLDPFGDPGVTITSEGIKE